MEPPVLWLFLPLTVSSYQYIFISYSKIARALMGTIIMRLSDELHDKVRWLAFKEKRSQVSIIRDALEKALKDVRVPEEAKE
jgi:hypothetical protein